MMVLKKRIKLTRISSNEVLWVREEDILTIRLMPTAANNLRRYQIQLRDMEGSERIVVVEATAELANDLGIDDDHFAPRITANLDMGYPVPEKLTKIPPQQKIDITPPAITPEEIKKLTEDEELAALKEALEKQEKEEAFRKAKEAAGYGVGDQSRFSKADESAESMIDA